MCYNKYRREIGARTKEENQRSQIDFSYKFHKVVNNLRKKCGK